MSAGRLVTVVGIADPDPLGRPERVRAFLFDLVHVLGMRPLGEPVVHDVELDVRRLGVEPFEDEGGVTGVLVLSTSHIAIHTWPLRNTFTLSVYSCRTFRDSVVTTCCVRHFGLARCRLTDQSESLRLPE